MVRKKEIKESVEIIRAFADEMERQREWHHKDYEFRQRTHKMIDEMKDNLKDLHTSIALLRQEFKSMERDLHGKVNKLYKEVDKIGTGKTC